jgi:hypothetical protein
MKSAICREISMKSAIWHEISIKAAIRCFNQLEISNMA